MDELVPVIAILTTIGLPIATGLVLGVISMRSKHRERMGLINQGIIPPDTPERKANPNRMVSLRNGIVLMSLGVGISVGYLFWHFVLKLFYMGKRANNLTNNDIVQCAKMF